MRSLDVAVLGAGAAGLATALALARTGHRVTLVERDAVEDTSPEGAFDWSRRGIAHFLQPHQFLPRGRKELRPPLPEVSAMLPAAGAEEVVPCPKLPAPWARAGCDPL